MQLTSLIAAGLAVASTNAILLPPDVGIADEDVFSILPHPTGDDLTTLMAVGKETSLNLKCPGCPVRKYHRNGAITTHTNVNSHLELDFIIETVNGNDALVLNGLPIFPAALTPADQPLTARLIPEFKKKNHDFVQHKEPEVLSFGLLTRPVHADPENKMELFAVDLQIVAVGDVLVKGIQGVEVMVIRTPEGKLMIVEVDAVDKEILKGPSTPVEQCSSLLCQVKNMFKGVFSDFGFKPCSKNKNPELVGEIIGDADEGFREDHGRPEHHHGHHGHHGHSYGDRPKHHSWGRILGSIASDILLPVAFGVMAGVTASVLGMMVGTFVVHVWRVCVRGGGRCPRRRAAEATNKAIDEAVVVEEEKIGLMAEQEEDVEAPPAYANDKTESK